MTITESPPDVAGEIAAMNREQLTALAGTALDGLARAELAKRRSRDQARQRRRSDPVTVAWQEAAHAQYLRADEACRGELLSPRGMTLRVTPWPDLWRWPAWRMEHVASFELIRFFEHDPRITPGEYRSQHKANEEAERDDAMDEHERAAVRRDAGEGPEGTRVHRERRGDHVPGPASRREAAESREPARADAGRGPAVRPGPVVTAPTQAERLSARADEIRARSASRWLGAGEQAPAGVTAYPRAQEGSRGRTGAAVAIRTSPALVLPEPDGDKLLRDSRKFLRHFALWPSEAALNVSAVGAAAMHAKDPETGDPAWEYAYKLLYTAAEYGAGKSWMAKLTGSLCPKSKALLEPTKPSMIDLIAEQHTIIVTEVDELFATPGRNRGIIAVLNGCYEPGHYHTRKSGGKVQEVHLFANTILDGKDDILKATRGDMRGLASRCIVVQVKMAPDGYRRPRWDRRAADMAALGRDRLSQWMVREVADGMAEDLAEVPAEIGNPRRCSLYEPLFTVALRADKGDPCGYWSTAMAESAYQLEQALGTPDEDPDEAADLDALMASWDDE